MTKYESESETKTPNHWQLIRDVAVFQFKLALDGLRDIVLLPASLIAGVIGVIASPENPGKYFNRLLDFGRKSDVWINLFGATHHYPSESNSESSQKNFLDNSSNDEMTDNASQTPAPLSNKESLAGIKNLKSSDAYVSKLEEMLIAEYKRGGVVRNLKEHTDHFIERVQAEHANVKNSQRNKTQED